MGKNRLFRGLVLLALAAILYCVSSGLIFMILVAVLAIAGVVQLVSGLFADYFWWFKK